MARTTKVAVRVTPEANKVVQKLTFGEMYSKAFVVETALRHLWRCTDVDEDKLKPISDNARVGRDEFRELIRLWNLRKLLKRLPNETEPTAVDGKDSNETGKQD